MDSAEADAEPSGESGSVSEPPAGPLVFSDLDGTLLDVESYAWEPARPALRALDEAGGLLILATSKTAAEVRPLHRELGVVVSLGPVIVENGAAVHGWAGGPVPDGARRSADGGWKLVLGPDHGEVMEGLATLRRQTGLEIAAFTEMSEERAREATGLAGAALAAARTRRHSEPFLAPGADLEELRAVAAARGLSVTRGGRFFHLGGAVDKGEAARLVLDAYRAAGRTGPSVGLGDSLNDRGLLELVDRAVLIPGAADSYDKEVAEVRSDLILAASPGPVGWDDAMRGLLAEMTGAEGTPTAGGPVEQEVGGRCADPDQ